MMPGGCSIQWNSKLQTEIALSMMDAEYIALSQAMQELIPLRRLLSEFITAMKLPVIKSTVFEDNNGAISIATAVKMTPRTKYIAVKYHFFKSQSTSMLEPMLELGSPLQRLTRTDRRPTSLGRV
jgi:hypothetical protein